MTALRRQAQLIGTGLMGASIAVALRERGWLVTGRDADPVAAAAALAAGAIDRVGVDTDADLVIVAVPPGAVVDAAREALVVHPRAAVTDVASVKATITDAVSHPRFVGGHPMAGSEQDGVAGADPSMFAGAVWVLTPSDRTDPDAFALVHGMVTSLGADVVSISATEHDLMVAMVSHVPHLTAATLMSLASRRSEDHTALLRLAAGGFRDMTRIASGSPAIWPDICNDNSVAICDVLDDLINELGAVRELVAAEDRDSLLQRLEHARAARTNLPLRAVGSADLVEMRIAIADTPGQISLVTTTATELGANILDIEIAHSAEGGRGVLVLVVEDPSARHLAVALRAHGLVVSIGQLP